MAAVRTARPHLPPGFAQNPSLDSGNEADIESGSELDARVSTSSFVVPSLERPSRVEAGGILDEIGRRIEKPLDHWENKETEGGKQHQNPPRKRPMAIGDNENSGGSTDKLDCEENGSKSHVGKRQAVAVLRGLHSRCGLNARTCQESDMSGFESADELTVSEETSVVPDTNKGRLVAARLWDTNGFPTGRDGTGTHKLKLHRHPPKAIATMHQTKGRHPLRREGKLPGDASTDSDGGNEDAGADDDGEPKDGSILSFPAYRGDHIPQGMAKERLPADRPHKSLDTVGHEKGWHL